ncbi:piggyBac transposable element-derived protein 4-like [Saccostrea cucullata]|uniref:piggyBac transposable element-derived protein 4-like n=1 Tax=Saccostrea cuccullata TaxID=36930 RepID=UPI002ED2B236
MRLPTKNDYWRSSKWMFTTQFGKVMPRDRFTQIWRYLHLQNNEEQPQQPDKLWKIRWFIEFLNTKLKELYVPHENVTIDESMIKFKGRLAFRQYLPAKPIEWGVKIWIMAESDTGYMHNFQIYKGKENNTEKGLVHRVVMDLCRQMFGTNLNVYMDNFYTSPQLLLDLHVRGILACGTVRSNRKGLPKELLPARINLEKHVYKVDQNDSLTFCVWKDTKPVLVLSNFHDSQHTGQVTRQAATDTIVEVPCLLSDYQKYMKGVHLCDQMIGYYILHHRSKKWWRRIFFYLMIVSAHNAYFIAKDTHPEMSKDRWQIFQDFVEEILKYLIGDTRSGREALEFDCGGQQRNTDTKPVLVLSNFHDPQHTGWVMRRTAEDNIVEVPLQLADYQKYMKGVDTCDQMIAWLLHAASSIKEMMA